MTRVDVRLGQGRICSMFYRLTTTITTTTTTTTAAAAAAAAIGTG